MFDNNNIIHVLYTLMIAITYFNFHALSTDDSNNVIHVISTDDSNNLIHVISTDDSNNIIHVLS